MKIKQIVLFSMAAWTLSAQASTTGNLTVNSRIAEVTVYSDRARVTRTAEIQLPEGDSIVSFTGLPALLDESSVQATGDSVGSVKIDGIEIRKKFSERTINDAVLKLQEDIQKIDDQNQKLDDEARDINERRAFLAQLRDGVSRDFGKDPKVAPLTAAQLKSLYDFYGNEIKSLSERARSIELEKRTSQPKRAKLQNEINRLMGGEPTVQREVIVSVRSDTAAAARLSISYVVPGASWVPVYDARARVEAKRIDLSYYALVRQQTGEAWKDVKLSLSTARPNIGARMEELQPWWLNVGMICGNEMPASCDAVAGMFRDQKKAELCKSVVAQNSMGYLAGEVGEKDKEGRREDMSQVQAELDSHGVSAVFHSKLPASIPSDGEPHRSMITIQQFKGKLDYVTTPKLLQVAFLKAHLANSTEFPIIGGQVNLFLEDDFIGKSWVNYISPSAEFDFYLGVDDGVKVTRKPLVERTETAGLIRKDIVTIRKYEIVVENFKKTAQNVTVYDQIPVSQNEQITISGVAYSEKPKSVEKETGKVQWDVALKPGEKKKITLEFSVSRPEGTVVAGI
jgi:uncharacterized protein (TIGR02231 family)